jgi:hypothetical protein
MGAYDGETVYDEVLHRHPAARVIIPPRSTAVLSGAGTTQRDEHLRSIQNHGRIGWQRRSGYGRRSLVETAMYRYKTIIGRRLHARTLPNQKTEAKIACNALNKMTGLVCRSPSVSNKTRPEEEMQPELYSCTNPHPDTIGSARHLSQDFWLPT